jgi:hypothetical protein
MDYLTETAFSPGNVDLNKNRTVGNVLKVNDCINI